MTRIGHRAIVRAALAWYRGTLDPKLSEKERGRLRQDLKGACKRVEPERCGFGACNRPRESHEPYVDSGGRAYITGHPFTVTQP